MHTPDAVRFATDMTVGSLAEIVSGAVIVDDRLVATCFDPTELATVGTDGQLRAAVVVPLFLIAHAADGLVAFGTVAVIPVDGSM